MLAMREALRLSWENSRTRYESTPEIVKSWELELAEQNTIVISRKDPNDLKW